MQKQQKIRFGSTSSAQRLRRFIGLGAMPLRGRRIALAILSATFLTGTVMARRAEAQTFTTLHNFSGSPNDGGKPAAGLIRDSSGDLYGTTVYGGSSTACSPGCGTVFKLDASGTMSVLHNFSGGDGVSPTAGLTLDSAGNLYGRAIMAVLRIRARYLKSQRPEAL